MQSQDLLNAGWTPVFGGGENVGTVGEKEESQLFNPVASGRVMYVERCAFVTGAATQQLFGQLNSGQLPAGRVQLFTQSRWTDGLTPVGEVYGRSTTDALVIGPFIIVMTNSANPSFIIVPLGLYLMPGDDIKFTTSAFNVNIDANYWWWEIPITDFR